MALKDQMPLTQAFHMRTASIHSSMVARFKQKENKNGRVIRVGRIVPFTLAEFRLWLLEQLGGKPDGSTRCAYCTCPLFADTLRVDHKIPASFGGELSLSNCCCCCDLCNRAKGQLSAGEFMALRIALDQMLHDGRLSIAGHGDVWKRLRGQTAIFRRFQANKAKPKPESSGLLVDLPEQQKLLVHKLPREF
jgi:hypothetical protein